MQIPVWFIFSLFLAVLVAIQDFKSRLISLWLLLAYIACSAVYVLAFENSTVLLTNLYGNILYLLFLYTVMVLFYFLKTRRLSLLINDKFGMADVLLLIGASCTMPIEEFMVFILSSFVIAGTIGFLFMKKSQTIPLGGILAICHNIFLGVYLLN